MQKFGFYNVKIGVLNAVYPQLGFFSKSYLAIVIFISFKQVS